jgi:hypothetical protein
MSGSDGEGGDFGGEERREEKEKKKKKKERTPEEREERRRRKEAERNAEANASLGGDGDDGEGGPSFSPQSLHEMRSPSARGDDPESPGGASMRSRAGETSDDVPVKSKKPGLIGRVVGAASGAVVGAVVGALRAVGLASKPVDLNDGYDGPLFVKPSRAKARAYARDANVMQTRAGIKVYMEDDALEHLDGDEIFAEIYQQCERKGISVTKVTKTGTCAATGRGHTHVAGGGPGALRREDRGDDTCGASRKSSPRWTATGTSPGDRASNATPKPAARIRL